MPYKAFPEGNGYKVYKVDSKGNKVGKGMSKSPIPKKDADAQVSALYANEKGGAIKKEAAAEPNPDEIFITPATGTIKSPVTWNKDVFGDITPRIVEIDKTKDHGEMDDMPMMMPMMDGPCSWEEYDAMEQAEEMTEALYGMNEKMGMMAHCVMRNPMIEDKAAALADLARGYVDRMAMMAKPVEKSVDDIAKQIAGDNQPKKKETQPEPELLIWKEGDTYRWISAYSNNRQDDEAEIISSQSHKEFDQALHNKEWPMPELYLWHIPYPVGQADYHAYDESSGFPVAAGHFYGGMEWAAEGVLKEGWNGASHGMPEKWLKYDPTNNKVIIRHRTKEITFLPLWAAANKLAFSIINKEKEMDEVTKGLPAHKRPEFVKAFGEERVKQIEDALASKSKEADEAGVAKKSLEETPTLTKEDFVKGLEVVLDKVKEAMDSLDTRLGKLEAAQVKEADAFDIMAQLKAKSIIGNDAAKVRANSALAKDAPEETQPEAANQHPVSLINNLFAANAAWAERLSGGR